MEKYKDRLPPITTPTGGESLKEPLMPYEAGQTQSLAPGQPLTESGSGGQTLEVDSLPNERTAVSSPHSRQLESAEEGRDLVKRCQQRVRHIFQAHGHHPHRAKHEINQLKSEFQAILRQRS